MLHLVVNLQKWNELPKPYQATLRNAAEAANNWMLAKYDYVNPDALRRMIGAGAELRSFTQPVMEASLKAANELYGEMSAKNEDFKKAYESMVEYRGNVLPWWQLNEYAYDTFMIRTRGRA
jgi:TRAP-type mannitol/chloroaromatic compound transport system substrate-binding protein